MFSEILMDPLRKSESLIVRYLNQELQLCLKYTDRVSSSVDTDNNKINILLDQDSDILGYRNLQSKLKIPNIRTQIEAVFTAACKHSDVNIVDIKITYGINPVNKSITFIQILTIRDPLKVSSFDVMCQDLIDEIISHLDLASRVKFMRTCKDFHNKLDNKFWFNSILTIPKFVINNKIDDDGFITDLDISGLQNINRYDFKLIAKFIKHKNNLDKHRPRIDLLQQKEYLKLIIRENYNSNYMNLLNLSLYLGMDLEIIHLIKNIDESFFGQFLANFLTIRNLDIMKYLEILLQKFQLDPFKSLLELYNNGDMRDIEDRGLLFIKSEQMLNLLLEYSDKKYAIKILTNHSGILMGKGKYNLYLHVKDLLNNAEKIELFELAVESQAATLLVALSQETCIQEEYLT